MTLSRFPVTARAIAFAAALSQCLSPVAAQTAAADGPRATLPQTRKYVDRLWAAELPDEWRQMGREEALDLADRLPFDVPLGIVQDGQVAVFGAIDRWRQDGLRDGCLVVVTKDGEQIADDALIAELRDHYANARTDAGDRCEVLAAELAELGPSTHPGLLLSRRLIPGDGGPVLRATDVYASTSGHLLILSFRTWENEWTAFEPRLRGLASSLTFARPPRRPGERGDRLLQAAVFGGVIVAVLFLLRAFLRGRPPEHQLPSTSERGPEPGSHPTP